MPKRKPQLARPGTDQYSCPGPVSGTFGVKRHVIAEAMRQADRTQPLTVAEAKRWRDHPEQASEEGVAVLVAVAVAVAAAQAEREHRERQVDIEYEHRMMILWEKVERRLLAGAKHFRNPDAELIAADIAFRAGKELVRAHADVCGQFDPSFFSEVDMAALRWAGVDPFDHSTWVVHRGDCRV